MKIKIITCHHVINHGSMLQAYALSAFLNSLGHEVEIIDYNPYLKEQCSLFSQHPKLKRIGLGWLYALLKLPVSLQRRKRRLSFDRFYNAYLKTTPIYYPDLKTLRENPPQADVYVAGSDQIWNTILDNGKDPAFYLDFGNNSTRRISYAASFAVSEVQPEWKVFIEQELKNFNIISVREASAVKLAASMGCKATQVLDPVFLLSKTQWQELIDNASKDETDEYLNNPYILVYDFMRDGSVEAVAKRIAKKRILRIYTIYRSSYSDHCFFYSNPIGFLRLIRNAESVVSDSFHGTAFSMIFQKDFFVVNRRDGLNTRMLDLLETYHLSDRLVSASTPDNVLFSRIDYTLTNQKVAQDIKFSQQWLGTNLQNSFRE